MEPKMKLRSISILAALLLSGTGALAQVHSGTDGVAPYSTPDPNSPNNLRSGNQPTYGGTTGQSGGGSRTSPSTGAQPNPPSRNTLGGSPKPGSPPPAQGGPTLAPPAR
jgi:hypothetical protein